MLGDKAKRPKIVEVTWEDTSYTVETMSRSRAEEHRSVVLRTVGHLVSRTDQYTTIAGEYEDANDTFRFVHTIPASCIREIRTMRR